MAFRLRYAAISDVGRVRKDNQDSGYVGPWMLAVCDGVGGAARGDLASATAIGQLRKLDAQPPSEDMHAQVAGALAPGQRPHRRARRRRPLPERHQHHRHDGAVRRRRS